MTKPSKTWYWLLGVDAEARRVAMVTSVLRYRVVYQWIEGQLTVKH